MILLASRCWVRHFYTCPCCRFFPLSTNFPRRHLIIGEFCGERNTETQRERRSPLHYRLSASSKPHSSSSSLNSWKYQDLRGVLASSAFPFFPFFSTLYLYYVYLISNALGCSLEFPVCFTECTLVDRGWGEHLRKFHHPRLTLQPRASLDFHSL